MRAYAVPGSGLNGGDRGPRRRLDRRKHLAILVVFLLVTGLAVVMPAAVEAAAPTLPSGFQRIATPSAQTAGNLVDFAFLPDTTGATSHNLITLGKAGGSVRFVDAAGTNREIGHIDGVYTDGDYGLLSLSLAPDYLTSGQLAILGTYNSSATRADGSMIPMSRLDIYRANNPTAPTALTFVKTVIGGISQRDGIEPTNSHGSGTVVWAPDGSFFAGFGDAAGFGSVDPLALRALDPDDPHGKILHIDSSGNAVSPNPFFGKAPSDTWRARMFASGFRNPFRFSLDPTRSNVLYVGDVGWGSYEKIVIVQAGTVGGWPCFEGVDGQGGFRSAYQDLPQCQGYYGTNQIYQPGTMTPKETIAAPSTALFNLYRAGRSAAIVGGVFYQGSSYPADYQGAYFFGDYPPDAPSKLYTLRTDGTTLTRAPEAAGFGSFIGGPVAIHTGPGGDLYYADLNTGTIWQLKYAPGNRPPEAHVSTTTEPATGTVCFDASASTDPDNDPLTVSVAFGDGASTNAAPYCHAYTGNAYTATVTVTDTLGAASSVTVAVAPHDNPPTLTLVSGPATGQRFAVGSPVQITLKVDDAQDGPQPVTEQTVMLHCTYATDCHQHYEAAATLTPDTSGNVSFGTTFADHGQNTSQVFTFTVTDKQQVATNWTYQANPDLRTVTVSSPTNVTIDGLAANTLQVAVGSNNSVSVPATSEDLAFTQWSNGATGNVTAFVMPATDLTLTATYTSAIDAYAAQLGGKAGTPIGPEVSTADGRMRPFQYDNVYWSAATGAHEVRNGNLGKYLTLGGPTVVGFPTTDETATPDGRGAFNRFTGGEIYWTAATGSQLVKGGILGEWAALGRELSRLGYPLTDELDAGSGGRFNVFEHGYIVWRPDTGAHMVINGIRARYDSLGGSRGRLGFPVTDELTTADGIGAFNFFTGGAVFWSPTSGPNAVFGGILQKWSQLGYERSRLGYPISGELDAGTGGWYNAFQNGYIVWRADTGAHMVVNGIRAYYDAVGGSRGFLGFPTTDETPTPEGIGAYNDFTGGSVYWSPSTGVHAVVNGILSVYNSIGDTTSRLGFPVSDELTVPGGWRSDFQGGSIFYSTTGQVTITYK